MAQKKNTNHWCAHGPGGPARRGCGHGGLRRCRVAGLQARIKQLGHQVEDIGNISVKQPEEMSYGEKRAKYLAERKSPMLAKDLGAIVEKIPGMRAWLPVVLGRGTIPLPREHCRELRAYFQKEGKEDRADLAGCARRPSIHRSRRPSGNVARDATGGRRWAMELWKLVEFARPSSRKWSHRIFRWVGIRDLDTQEEKAGEKVRRARFFTMRGPSTNAGNARGDE